jgi:hypothetical protein
MLRKEFGLAIHPMYVASGFIFGAFALIPQWVYTLIPLYFCWVSVPILMSQYKSNKDNEFSALLPVSRNSIVAARIAAFSILELCHVAGAAIFAVVHALVYPPGNFLLELGPGFFGVMLAIYGVFNLVLFPLYFGTARKFGVPLILAIVVVLLITGGVETLNMTSPVVSSVLEGSVAAGTGVLAAGLVVFLVLGYLTYVLSAPRFRAVQL